MNQEKTIFDKFKTYLIFAGPSTFIFFTVIILPFLFGIYLTFTDWNGIAATQRFVGTENYSAVFKDKEFWGALGKTMYYVL
jgi:raffinose/stachyose/melibiose transport system permease protein